MIDINASNMRAVNWGTHDGGGITNTVFAYVSLEGTDGPYSTTNVRLVWSAGKPEDLENLRHLVTTLSNLVTEAEGLLS